MTYIGPSSTNALPRGLTLSQFLQTVFVGITMLPGPLVRPMWQVEPPKQPDLTTNWMGIGISTASPDTYGYLGTNEDGAVVSQRQETIEVACAIYGPAALEIYGLIRDGFQVPQNLEALRTALMGYTEMEPARTVPDLVHERWINRVQTSIFLRREILRTYPILTILSATGSIHTVIGNEPYLLDWEVGEDT